MVILIETDANNIPIFNSMESIMKARTIYIYLLLLGSLQCVAQEQFQPDSTINGIFILRNSNSIQDFYKEISDIHLQEEQSACNPFGYSFVAFVNKDSSQYLMAFKYDGDAANSYSAFEIGYVTTDFFRCIGDFYTTEFDTFKTESGICLSMPYYSILKLKGTNYFDNYNVITYYWAGDNSAFVKRHKMPSYYLKCEFNSEKTCNVQFGFTYP